MGSSSSASLGIGSLPGQNDRGGQDYGPNSRPGEVQQGASRLFMPHLLRGKIYASFSIEGLVFLHSARDKSR